MNRTTTTRYIVGPKNEQDPMEQFENFMNLIPNFDSVAELKDNFVKGASFDNSVVVEVTARIVENPQVN